VTCRLARTPAFPSIHAAPQERSRGQGTAQPRGKPKRIWCAALHECGLDARCSVSCITWCSRCSSGLQPFQRESQGQGGRPAGSLRQLRVPVQQHPNGPFLRFLARSEHQRALAASIDIVDIYNGHTWGSGPYARRICKLRLTACIGLTEHDSEVLHPELRVRRREDGMVQEVER
jgi:hypothetical protein